MIGTNANASTTHTAVHTNAVLIVMTWLRRWKTNKSAAMNASRNPMKPIQSQIAIGVNP
jgi:hypothetical protein